jgi:hypothetical protein
MSNKLLTDEQFRAKIELSRIALTTFDIQDRLNECKNVGMDVSNIERKLYDMKAEIYLAMDRLETLGT